MMIPFPVSPMPDIGKVCWQYGKSMADGSGTGDWAPGQRRVNLSSTRGAGGGRPAAEVLTPAPRPGGRPPPVGTSFLN